MPKKGHFKIDIDKKVKVLKIIVKVIKQLQLTTVSIIKFL